MKFDIKRLLCLLLAALMALSMVACATTTEDDNGTKAATDEAASDAETTDPNYTCDLDPSLNYNNEIINIIYCKHSGREDELYTEGYGYGTLSDAVYERNVAVENMLGVKFELIAEDSTTGVPAKVDSDIKGNTHAYDLVVDGTYTAVTPAMEGKYIDLSILENINTSKFYWTQGYNDLVTFTENRHQFLASGPVAISMSRLMYATIYNKKVFANMQEKDLYEVVLNGEWTMEYQNNLITGKYVDSDGDSKKSDGDTYGFITGSCVSCDPYMVAADLHMIIKDPDTYELKFNDEDGEKLVDLVTTVQLLYNNEATYVFKDQTYDDVGLNYITDCFAQDKSMMATIMFWNLENNFEDLAGLTYGIAPIPKYLASGEYHSYVQDQVSSFGISAGVADNARQEMLAAVLEALAYHSYIKVRPAYYDISLSSRYMQDPESKEILDMLFDSLSFDFSSTCGNIIVGCVIRDSLRPIFSSSKNTVASSVKGWKKTIDRKLKSYNNQLDKLDQ